MKLVSEALPQPPIDDYLQLLVVLWKTETSVNLVVSKGELNVYPAPPDHLAEWIQKHYDKLEHWLPGLCDGCSSWCLERIETYWSHAHLCFRCTAIAVSHFEVHGKWPDPIWYKGEESCGEPE